MPLSIQAFSGIFWIAGYATYYFQLAGYTTSESFHLGIIQQCLSVFGNVLSVSVALTPGYQRSRRLAYPPSGS
jgi:hypothetical protein